MRGPYTIPALARSFDNASPGGSSPHIVTDLLRRWQAGDTSALEHLLPLVHVELRRLAAAFLRHERQAPGLDTHDLIHEAFLRLVSQRDVDWQGRAHFFGLAARMMRRVLIDLARRRRRTRHGGQHTFVTLAGAEGAAAGRPPEVTELDEALRELERADAELGRIVELRFFGGLDHDEIAAVLGLSNPTVRRRWRLARAWLHARLRPAGEPSEPEPRR
jgi:RNA polymerase sigma factor (TIGR02999 family)